ncbi:CreA family protein [Ancylobacter sp. G4_0304]|uniref:CreA family protein n=1 Tax=Ancylobacter sp. G4_0304 TaxID=3114289 RepID=UPI0039C607E2
MHRVVSRAVSCGLLAFAVIAAVAFSPDAQAQEPSLIFKKSTVWKFLTPDDKLATYAIDDPVVEGVACYYTIPERGGVKGMLGVAEEVSDISIACRQVGPIAFTSKFGQGDVAYRESRSLIFKKMQIVRGCDTTRNVLVYLVYSDKLIDGSPKNSTTAVPIMPWGAQTEAPKCADFLN